MKKLLAALVFALFVAALVPAAESPMYAKVFPIVKITSHEKGYRVAYLTGHGDLKTVYIALEWFYPVSEYKTADGFVRAELVRGMGPAYPYLQVFWKDGQFHHLRLFVVQSYSDRTWGVVHVGEDFSAKFDPAKPLDLQY
jgi:hypothetical protein